METKEGIGVHIENYDDKGNGYGTATVDEEEYRFFFNHNSSKLIFTEEIDEDLAGEIQAFYNGELEKEAECIVEMEYEDYLEGEGKVILSGLVEDWCPIMCLGASMYATEFRGMFDLVNKTFELDVDKESGLSMIGGPIPLDMFKDTLINTILNDWEESKTEFEEDPEIEQCCDENGEEIEGRFRFSGCMGSQILVPFTGTYDANTGDIELVPDAAFTVADYAGIMDDLRDALEEGIQQE